MAEKLSAKERAFCKEYWANGRNGTRAYMKAFGLKNYNSAGVEGSKLLKKVSVRDYINRLESAYWKERQASRDEVVALITAMARGETLCDNVVVEGTGKGYSEARIKRARPKDAVMRQAMADLAKIYGLFNDNNVLVNVGVEIVDDIKHRIKNREEEDDE